MSDDETGPVLAQVGHGLLDEEFGARVDRARRLAEDEQCRVTDEGSRNGQQRCFSPAEMLPASLSSTVS